MAARRRLITRRSFIRPSIRLPRISIFIARNSVGEYIIPTKDIIFRKWLTFSRWTPPQVAALSLPARSTRCNLLPARWVTSCLPEDVVLSPSEGRLTSTVCSRVRSTVSRAWLRLLLGFWSVEAVFLAFVPFSTYDINDPRSRTTWRVNPRRDGVFDGRKRWWNGGKKIKIYLSRRCISWVSLLERIMMVSERKKYRWIGPEIFKRRQKIAEFEIFHRFKIRKSKDPGIISFQSLKILKIRRNSRILQNYNSLTN